MADFLHVMLGFSSIRGFDRALCTSRPGLEACEHTKKKEWHHAPTPNAPHRRHQWTRQGRMDPSPLALNQPLSRDDHQHSAQPRRTVASATSSSQMIRTAAATTYRARRDPGPTRPHPSAHPRCADPRVKLVFVAVVSN